MYDQPDALFTDIIPTQSVSSSVPCGVRRAGAVWKSRNEWGLFQTSHIRCQVSTFFLDKMMDDWERRSNLMGDCSLAAPTFQMEAKGPEICLSGALSEKITTIWKALFPFSRIVLAWLSCPANHIFRQPIHPSSRGLVNSALLVFYRSAPNPRNEFHGRLRMAFLKAD